MQNDRLLRALMREPVDRAPIWLMRQAGRYLPEYRAIRKEAGSFMALCQNPELACEVTMQPLRRYDLDAAILFSDILTIPDAMGLGLYFVEGEGPKFKYPIKTQADVDALQVPCPAEHLGYVMDAVSTIRKTLNGRVPLIGFSGSPWTLACYMIEGGSSRDFKHIKTMLYDAPNMLHQVLSVLSDAIIHYLNAQIESGAQVVMLFDTWGGVLSGPAYKAFSLHYMHKIIDGLCKEREGKKIPNIVFTKQGGLWLESIADIGCDAIGLDWTISLRDAIARVGDKVALQGNLDPAVLRAKPSVIKQETIATLQEAQGASGYVFNLGHGLTPDLTPENVGALVDSVTGYKKLAT